MKRATLALAAVAWLGAPASGAGPLAFPAVDINGDGVVTWEEAHRKMPLLKRVHFEKCDPGGDGLIDRNEYPLLSTFYWSNYLMPD